MTKTMRTTITASILKWIFRLPAMKTTWGLDGVVPNSHQSAALVSSSGKRGC